MATIRLVHPGDPALLLAAEIARQAKADIRDGAPCTCGQRRSRCASAYLDLIRENGPYDATGIALDMLRHARA